MEAYKKRLAVAESVYAKSHNGEQMSNTRKLITAVTLQNVNKFLSEAFDNSVGTQRADMGLYKKFCLNLTNLAVPTLIAPDLVMVHPMTSMSGYVAYLKITAGTNKGETQRDENNPYYLMNSPFQLGKVDRNYTSASVVEAFTTGQTNLAWAPCLTGMFYNTAADGTRTVLGDVKVTTAANPTVSYFGTFASAAARETGLLTGMTFKDSTGTTQSYTIVNGDKIAYAYNNVIIPQNDLPIVNAEMDSIPLIAKARRVAIKCVA